MEERKLGPVVGLGTFATFEDDESLARDVVEAALGAGVGVFDSSPMYGPAERSLGAALDSRRSEATLATKVKPARGASPQGSPPSAARG